MTNVKHNINKGTSIPKRKTTLIKTNKHDKIIYHKKTIPKAVREQCWINTFGSTYKNSCYIQWCTNIINVFDFHVGHDIPESDGGSLDIHNLKPICARCNLSMSNNFTISQWNVLTKKQNKTNCCGGRIL